MRGLRVMTYNIRGARGMDGRVDIDRIAGIAEEFAPDVLMLQEVDVFRARSGDVDQAHHVATRLGLDVRFGATIERGREAYGIATLTRLPIVETQLLCLPWSAADPRSEPRCALVTRVCWDGRELEVVNTHLSVRSTSERQDQVVRLLAGLDSCDRIIGGDFNCTPWSRPFRTLCGDMRPAASPRSWPSPLPVIPIDHILYRGALRVVEAGPWRNGDAWFASDHLPVVAELSVGSDDQLA